MSKIKIMSRDWSRLMFCVDHWFDWVVRTFYIQFVNNDKSISILIKARFTTNTIIRLNAI